MGMVDGYSPAMPTLLFQTKGKIMNGKKSKYLRRSAFFITDLPTSYSTISHVKRGNFPEFNEKGNYIGHVEKEYVRYQTILGNCTRQVYQLMKRKPKDKHAT